MRLGEAFHPQHNSAQGVCPVDRAVPAILETPQSQVVPHVLCVENTLRILPTRGQSRVCQYWNVPRILHWVGVLLATVILSAATVVSVIPAGAKPSLWPSSEPFTHSGSSVLNTSAISCTGPLTCEVLTASWTTGLVATQESNGVWGQAVSIQSSAAFGLGDDPVEMSCWSTGNCLAAAQEFAQSGPGAYYIAAESNGIWGPLSSHLPTGPGGLVPDGGWTLGGLSCAPSGWCAITLTSVSSAGGGTYELDWQSWSAGVLSSVSDTGLANPNDALVSCWGTRKCEFFSSQNFAYAVNPSRPSDWHSLNGGTYQGGSILYSASCTSALHCTIVGQDQNVMYPIAFTESGSTWNQYDFTNSPVNSELYSVSCVAEFCAMVGTAAGGTSLTGSTQDGVPTLTSTPSFYQSWGISCTDVLTCTALGTSSSQLATSNLAPPLVVPSTSHGTATIGQSLSRDLASGVTGGIGSTFFSIQHGHLPPGITLNESTGVLSGVPTHTGTFQATVKVESTGPPFQSSTIALVLTVTQQPAPSPPVTQEPGTSPQSSDASLARTGDDFGRELVVGATTWLGGVLLFILVRRRRSLT